MKTLIDPTEHDEILAQWRGAEASIWACHVGLRRVAIDLIRKGDTDALYILGVGSEHVAGPLYWKQANVTIITEPPDQQGKVRRRVIDRNAGFELLCSDIALVRGPATSPVDPFENFLG